MTSPLPSAAALSHAAPPTAPSVRLSAVARWAVYLLILWGFPSLVFWGTADMYIRLQRQDTNRKAFENLETRLVEISRQCLPQVHYGKEIDAFFSGVKGRAARPESMGRIVEGFVGTYPRQSIDVYLFAGDGSILYSGAEAKGLEIFFRLVSQPWTAPLNISPPELQAIGKVLPSPEMSAKTMKGRGGRLLELGGVQRFSWGYHKKLDGISEKCVGGILVFLHQRYLEPTRILDAVLCQKGETSLGYLFQNGKSCLPADLQGFPEGTVEQLFRQSSQNRCEHQGHLIVFHRLSQTSVLVITTPVVPGPKKILLVLAIAYALGSLLILHWSFRVMVLAQKTWVSIRWKLFFFILLAFGLPWLGAAILGILIYKEANAEHFDQVIQSNYQRLADLDEGFAQDLIFRSQQFARIIDDFRGGTPDLKQIESLANQLFDNDDIDNFHLIASDATLVFNQSNVPVELRTWLKRPVDERALIFRSLIDRGSILTFVDVQRFLSTDSRPIDYSHGETGTFRDMLLRIIKQAGLLAIEEYNQKHGIGSRSLKSARDLAEETIIDEESGGLLKQLRNHIGTFVELRGGQEQGRVFVEVLPGPTGEGWYGIFIFNGLVGMSHHFLRPLFSQRLATDATTLHLGAQEDIRAVSMHHRTENMPDFFEYVTFRDHITRFDQSPRPQSWSMELDGQRCLVSALRCSFLANHVLFSIIREDEIERIVQRETRPILIWLAGLGLFGLLAGALLSYRFLTPVWDLTQGVHLMQQSDFRVRLPVRSRDEFGELAVSFNHAIQHLEDMALAMPLQRELLPRQALKIGSYSLLGQNEMTQAIGGDYFDFIPLRQGKIAIILGDVSGHGVSAALVTAMAKAAFSILVPRFQDNPREIMARINASLHAQLQKAKMMTCFLGILDPAANSLMAVNAGQCYPVLGSKNQKPVYLSLPSTPLGIRKKLVCTPREIDMSGAWLLLFSDGAVEAANSNQEQFGYDRLLDAMGTIMSRPGKDPGQELLATLRDFTKDVPWNDDVTLVLIRSED